METAEDAARYRALLERRVEQDLAEIVRRFDAWKGR